MKGNHLTSFHSEPFTAWNTLLPLFVIFFSLEFLQLVSLDLFDRLKYMRSSKSEYVFDFRRGSPKNDLTLWV